MALVDKLSKRNRNRLWIDQGGQTACTAHAGHYMLYAIAENPQADEHTTPLGHWIAVDTFGKAFAHEYTCEVC